MTLEFIDWHDSKNGNPVASKYGWRMTVYPDKFVEDTFAWVMSALHDSKEEPHYSSAKHPTQADAQRDAMAYARRQKY